VCVRSCACVRASEWTGGRVGGVCHECCCV